MPTIEALPMSESEWDLMAKPRGLQSVSIFGDHKRALKSASVMDFDQFLLLRTLTICKFPPNDLLDSGYNWSIAHRTAVASLEAQESWSLYLDSIKKGLSGIKSLGLFSLVWHYQLRVCPVEGPDSTTLPIHRLAIRPRLASERSTQPQAQTPQVSTRRGQEAPSTRPNLLQDTLSQARVAIDEQIVNVALILYLNALTLCSEAQGEWTPHRKGFVLKSQEGEKVYEARVDGYLHSSNQDVQAIVEVKACHRHAKTTQIQMQEAGEMAAWIGTNPPDVRIMREQKKLCRRLLISQDREEIYIIIAEFDADYVDYICDRPARRSFLKMREYGPFLTRNHEYVATLGHLILAFTIDQSVLDRPK
ncbi:hypothetical protein F4861DRAFT_539412 [Xylaria intraflava]|nr:hypothetical protein F4861DRAFT_539412 [Xylaria intraflava]